MVNTFLFCMSKSKVHEIMHVKVYSNYIISFFSKKILYLIFIKVNKENTNS
jgi:hypothetical protein